MKRLVLVVLIAACRRDVVDLDFDRAGVAPNAVAPHAVIAPNDAVRRLRDASWESTIAISPANPNLVLATAMRWVGNDYRSDILRSEDGGRTWSEPIELPRTIGSVTYSGSGDPVLAIDRTGTAYISLLMRGPNASKPTNSALVVFRSTDDGRTWIPFPLTQREAVNGRLPFFDDKEWLAVDTSTGPHAGRLFLGWIISDGYSDATTYELQFAYSDDGGASWTKPQTFGKKSIAFVQVGPDGTVYFSHSGGTGYAMQHSLDGGATWSAESNIARMGLPSSPPPNLVNNPLNVLQQFTVDQSNGSSRGFLYFVYPGDSGQKTAAIYFTRSTDRGVTWSAPRMISTIAADALLPTVASDPLTGDVTLAWVDRRADNNTLARLFTARSHDGGATFDAARALTSPFSIDARFIGHYNAIATNGDTRIALVSDAAGNLSAVQVPGATPRRRAVAR